MDSLCRLSAAGSIDMPVNKRCCCELKSRRQSVPILVLRCTAFPSTCFSPLPWLSQPPPSLLMLPLLPKRGEDSLEVRQDLLLHHTPSFRARAATAIATDLLNYCFLTLARSGLTSLVVLGRWYCWWETEWHTAGSR